MKSVSEIARELNISTQAIYKKINKTMKNELQLHIKDVGGKKYIDELGEEKIKNGLQPLHGVGNQQKDEVLTMHEMLDTDHMQPVGNQYIGSGNIGLQPVANQYIYKFSNASNEVLYIGQTINLHKRINLFHFSGYGDLPDECYLETEKVEYTRVKDNESSDEKEKYYINIYKPVFNKAIEYTEVNQVFDDIWCIFDFENNREEILRKHERVAKLEERNDLFEFLKEQCERLQSELEKEREHSRAQADKLAVLAEQLAELSRNNQMLLGVEQSRTNPVLLNKEGIPDDDVQPAKKKRFWHLFKKS